MVERSLSSTLLDAPVEQWDYDVQSIHARNDIALQEKLREKGMDGWELVAVNTPLAMEYHCIFKRRIH
jgi:hypothetical protein